MISCYNSVVRRPHVPRERILRRIMNAQGLDVEVDPSPQEPVSREFSESEDSEGEMGGGEEDMESEPATDDDDTVSVSGSLMKLAFFRYCTCR